MNDMTLVVCKQLLIFLALREFWDYIGIRSQDLWLLLDHIIWKLMNDDV